MLSAAQFMVMHARCFDTECGGPGHVFFGGVGLRPPLGSAGGHGPL